MDLVQKMTPRSRRPAVKISPHLCFFSLLASSTQVHLRQQAPVTVCKRFGLSLSLSFTQITCNNEHQCCQVITERKETFLVAHLCSIPPFSGCWCVWIQSRLTSCQSFSIPEPRRQHTGLFFAPHSGRTTVACPSRHPSSVSSAVKTCRST